MKTEGLSKTLEEARDNCTQLADMGVEKEMLEPFRQLIKECEAIIQHEYYKNSNVDEEYQDFTCVESKAEKVTRIAMKKLVKLIDSGKPFESELVGLKVCVKNSTSKPKKRGGRKL